MVASVQQSRELGRTQALADWGPEEVYPGPGVSDNDADLERYVRETTVTYHHHVGTCKMGPDDMTVVDTRTFEVYGLSCVRIADASMIIIAERAAAALVGSAPGGITTGFVPVTGPVRLPERAAHEAGT